MLVLRPAHLHERPVRIYYQVHHSERHELGGAGQKVATDQQHRQVARILEAVAQPRPDSERVALGEGRGLALASAAAPGDARTPASPRPTFSKHSCWDRRGICG